MTLTCGFMNHNSCMAEWRELGRWHCTTVVLRTWDFVRYIFEGGDSAMKRGCHIRRQLHIYLHLFHKYNLNNFKRGSFWKTRDVHCVVVIGVYELHYQTTVLLYYAIFSLSWCYLWVIIFSIDGYALWNTHARHLFTSTTRFFAV